MSGDVDLHEGISTLHAIMVLVTCEFHHPLLTYRRGYRTPGNFRANIQEDNRRKLECGTVVWAVSSRHIAFAGGVAVISKLAS